MTPKTYGFDVLFEDVHLLVLSKHAGILSQSDHSGQPSLVDQLRVYFGRHYVGLVHRLDRNTSGAMVVAKRSKAAERLSESLRVGNLCRVYLAALSGEIRSPQRWEHFLLKDSPTNKVKTVASHTVGAQAAALKLTPLETSVQKDGNIATLVRFELETGRSHQIRAQAAAEKHPLLGDIKYGGPKFVRRPMLHSHAIAFPHPMSKEKLKFEAPLPDDFRSLQFTWKPAPVDARS